MRIALFPILGVMLVVINFKLIVVGTVAAATFAALTREH